MKKTKLIATSIILTIMLFVAMFTGYSFTNRAQAATVQEAVVSKEYNESLQYDQMLASNNRIPSLNENFEDDEITIILDGEHSGTSVGSSYYDFDEILRELGKVKNLDVNSIEPLFDIDAKGETSSTYRRMYNIKLETTGKDKVIEVIEDLQSLDMILSAEPQYDYEVVSTDSYSDTYYGRQWGLTGTYGIDVESAWKIADGSGVRVGIFEKGIDTNHPDLAGRIAGSNFTVAAGTDLSHGTHVGGIISAIKNNGQGVAGVSAADLYLLDRNSPNFASSLSYAAEHNIKIINASFQYLRADGKMLRQVMRINKPLRIMERLVAY